MTVEELQKILDKFPGSFHVDIEIRSREKVPATAVDLFVDIEGRSSVIINDYPQHQGLKERHTPGDTY